MAAASARREPMDAAFREPLSTRRAKTVSEACNEACAAMRRVSSAAAAAMRPAPATMPPSASATCSRGHVERGDGGIAARAKFSRRPVGKRNSTQRGAREPEEGGFARAAADAERARGPREAQHAPPCRGGARVAAIGRLKREAARSRGERPRGRGEARPRERGQRRRAEEGAARGSDRSIEAGRGGHDTKRREARLLAPRVNCCRNVEDPVGVCCHYCRHRRRRHRPRRRLGPRRAPPSASRARVLWVRRCGERSRPSRGTTHAHRRAREGRPRRGAGSHAGGGAEA